MDMEDTNVANKIPSLEVLQSLIAEANQLIPAAPVTPAERTWGEYFGLTGRQEPKAPSVKDLSDQLKAKLAELKANQEIIEKNMEGKSFSMRSEKFAGRYKQLISKINQAFGVQEIAHSKPVASQDVETIRNTQDAKQNKAKENREEIQRAQASAIEQRTKRGLEVRERKRQIDQAAAMLESRKWADAPAQDRSEVAANSEVTPTTGRIDSYEIPTGAEKQWADMPDQEDRPASNPKIKATDRVEYEASTAPRPKEKLFSPDDKRPISKIELAGKGLFKDCFDGFLEDDAMLSLDDKMKLSMPPEKKAEYSNLLEARFIKTINANVTGTGSSEEKYRAELKSLITTAVAKLAEEISLGNNSLQSEIDKQEVNKQQARHWLNVPGKAYDGLANMFHKISVMLSKAEPTKAKTAAEIFEQAGKYAEKAKIEVGKEQARRIAENRKAGAKGPLANLIKNARSTQIELGVEDKVAKHKDDVKKLKSVVKLQSVVRGAKVRFDKASKLESNDKLSFANREDKRKISDRITSNKPFRGQ